MLGIAGVPLRETLLAGTSQNVILWEVVVASLTWMGETERALS
jgi:hypothetical protein